MFGIRKPFLFSAAIMAAVGLTAAGGAFAHGAQTARAENTDLTANQTVYTEGDNRFTFTCEEGQGWTLTAYEGTAKHLVLPAPERISVSSGQPAVESYAIGENVFTAAAAMRTVQLPEGVTAVGAGAFADTKLTELSLPETVTAIGAQAFRGCWVLGSVVFEEGENELTLALYECCKRCVRRLRGVGMGLCAIFGARRRDGRFFGCGRIARRVLATERLRTRGSKRRGRGAGGNAYRGRYLSR